MKGDFSRIRFNPAKQYTSVLKQQGRVDLDADANEQRLIDEELQRTNNVDVIGQCGGPENDAGFEIRVVNNAIYIGAGRYYVDGIMVENKQAMNYDHQPWLLDAPTAHDLLNKLLHGSPQATLGFHLEVWRRIVTGLDDPCLLEPALGQADTTVRMQTVWRVVGTVNDPKAGTGSTGTVLGRTEALSTAEIEAAKMAHEADLASRATDVPGSTGSAVEIPIGTTIGSPFASAPSPITNLSPCCQAMYKAAPDLHFGAMGASLAQGGNDCGCQPTAAAGYQGLENQLYRVEIHQGGDLSSATFKWSRENASVVAAVAYVGANSPTITVSSLGPDANLGFQAGQWVELTDDTYQFGISPNQPGPLFQIQSVNTTTLQVTMTAPVYGIDVTKNARMRRWDQSGLSATSSGIPVSSTPIALENGIEVDFRDGQFYPGDHWTFAARTANGQIDWPPCGGDGRHFQICSYFPIHVAPLACVSARNDYTVVSTKGKQGVKQEGRFLVSDCRLFFPPLTAVSADMAASALHVKAISWTNDDLMTVDTLLEKGLWVTLDQAPTCPWGGGNFQVILEPAYGPSLTNAISEQQFAVFTKASFAGPAGTDVILRTVFALDPPFGIAPPQGNTVNWLAPVTSTAAGGVNYQAEGFWFMLNLLLGGKTPRGYARVRVRLIGGAVYGSNAQGNIYLDGQSKGTTGTRVFDNSGAVNYALPSGSSSEMSDFEGWFYLAPTVVVTNVVIQGVNNNVEIQIKALKVIVDQNNQITSLQIGETATVTNLQASITVSYPPVSDTVVNLMFTGAGAGSVVTIASTVTVKAGQTTVTTPVNVVSNPGGGVTDTVTLVAWVQTAVLPLPSDVQPTLAITGMNPPIIIN